MIRRASTPEGMSEEARMVIVGASDLGRSAATVRDDLRAAAERCGGRQIEAYTVDDDRISVTFWVEVRDDEEARAIGHHLLDAVEDDYSYTVSVVHGWIG